MRFKLCGVPVHRRITNVTGSVLIFVITDLKVASVGMTSVAMITTTL